MNTFTAQELEEFSRCWSKKDLIGLIKEYSSNKEEVNAKPAKKVIDLSVLIDSQIDCEFWHSSRYPNQNEVGKLGDLTDFTNGWFYSTLKIPDMPNGNSNGQWKYCRPRMNHKHAWVGGECPLPEGFRVMLTLRDGTKINHSSKTKLTWGHDGGYADIITFEVLGLADGYVMPWEVSDE
jgi:hypothetical protein